MRRDGRGRRHLPAAVRPSRRARTLPGLGHAVERITERIRRDGPIPYSAFTEVALDEFFTHGGAGRSGGDFITSPEVGPLFGVLVGRALDDWWARLGEPDPFLAVDAGAGRGRLAASVLRGPLRCRGALRYVMVERSPTLSAEQRERLTVEPWEDALGPFLAAAGGDSEPEPVLGAGPVLTSLDGLPALNFDGVILANELLDNLPFDVVERTDAGWNEIRVGLVDDATVEPRFVEVAVPAAESIVPAFDAPPGARLPLQPAVEAWIAACASVLRRGAIVVIDYAAPATELVARGPGAWLRTFRTHARGDDPLVAPGTQDITTDLVVETLHRGARRAGLRVASEQTQAEWLRSLGIDQLVAEGRDHWETRADVGDLEALVARSRFTEAAALTDPAGLGAHTVTVLTKDH